jgi:hypothetical protein
MSTTVFNPHGPTYPEGGFVMPSRQEEPETLPVSEQNEEDRGPSNPTIDAEVEDTRKTMVRRNHTRPAYLAEPGLERARESLIRELGRLVVEQVQAGRRIEELNQEIENKQQEYKEVVKGIEEVGAALGKLGVEDWRKIVKESYGHQGQDTAYRVGGISGDGSL